LRYIFLSENKERVSKGTKFILAGDSNIMEDETFISSVREKARFLKKQ